MIVQIMSYDPDYFKEHVFVFSEVYFPYPVSSEILKGTTWMQFYTPSKLYSVDTVQLDTNWFRFVKGLTFSDTSSAVDKVSWFGMKVVNSLRYVLYETSKQIWLDSRPTEKLVHRNVASDVIRGADMINSGIFKNAKFPDFFSNVVLPDEERKASVGVIGMTSTYIGSMDNHVDEVLTTSISIQPTVGQESFPST